MSDPTPTPDALRAAIEQLCDLADEGSPAERQHSPRWHVATVDLRAALAASPAPTDTPDEREWCNDVIGPIERPTWFCTLPAGHDGNHEQRDDEDELEWSWRPRPAAVTAPREDEQGVFGDPTPEDVEAAYASWGVTAALAAVRATPDPDTLAALREAVEAYNKADTMHEVLDAARELAETANAFTTPEQGHTAP